MSIINVYKLDKIDRLILYELDKNCRISDNHLAKMAHLSREAIRNRIKKLQQNGIIQGFITSINPSKFGYMFFKLYFQLANLPKEREQFYAYFKKIPGLYWFGGNDGVWDFHATLYAQDVEEFNTIKNDIYTNFKDLIIRRDIGVLIEVYQFPKRFLLDGKQKRVEVKTFSGKVEHYALDDLDKKILQVLAQRARTSLVELANLTGSTIDKIRLRKKRMEEQKIIIQYRIALDHSKLGFDMYKAFIYFNHLSANDEAKLLEYAQKNDRILYVVKQLSSWDIEMEIMAENYARFNRIMDDLRLTFSNSLRNYESVLLREDTWVFGEKIPSLQENIDNA